MTCSSAGAACSCSSSSGVASIERLNRSSTCAKSRDSVESAALLDQVDHVVALVVAHRVGELEDRRRGVTSRAGARGADTAAVGGAGAAAAWATVTTTSVQASVRWATRKAAAVRASAPRPARRAPRRPGARRSRRRRPCERGSRRRCARRGPPRRAHARGGPRGPVPQTVAGWPRFTTAIVSSSSCAPSSV